MTIALCVVGNGRLDYLHETVDAALEHLPEMDHYLMIDDSGDAHVRRELTRHYPDFLLQSHAENLGMANAVNQGFRLVCETDADWVFWLEEDMLLLSPPPITEALAALLNYPQMAQMLFERQPLTPDEHAAGSVHGAMNGMVGYGDWTMHRHIFSLNPCIIPRHILERGWPPGNEREMTDRLLADGYTFGCWHGQYVEHIGHQRGAKWQL